MANNYRNFRIRAITEITRRGGYRVIALGRGLLCILSVSTHISCLPNVSYLHLQSKFAIGDLTTAKKYTLRAMAAEKDIKFADEKKSAKESKDLMDKINAILGDRQ